MRPSITQGINNSKSAAGGGSGAAFNFGSATDIMASFGGTPAVRPAPAAGTASASSAMNTPAASAAAAAAAVAAPASSAVMSSGSGAAPAALPAAFPAASNSGAASGASPAVAGGSSLFSGLTMHVPPSPAAQFPGTAMAAGGSGSAAAAAAAAAANDDWVQALINQSLTPQSAAAGTSSAAAPAAAGSEEWIKKFYSTAPAAASPAPGPARTTAAGSGSAMSSAAAAAASGGGSGLALPLRPALLPAPMPSAAPAAMAGAAAAVVARQHIVVGISRIQSSRTDILATHSLSNCIGVAAYDVATGRAAFTHYNTAAMMGIDKVGAAAQVRTAMLAVLRGHNPFLGAVRYHIALGLGWKLLDPTPIGVELKQALTTAFPGVAYAPGHSSFAAFDPRTESFAAEGGAGMKPIVDDAAARWNNQDGTAL